MNHHHHHPTEAHMSLFSHLYLHPNYTTQILPPQGEGMKRRRRRKRSKGGESVGVGMKKRKQLSEEQAKLLEQHFGKEHKLESERKDRLACELGLNPRQVAVWFQNRRARWKNQKLEQAYTDLKNLHETTLLEKCRLQTEVSKLKEELWEAEKEIQRLIESGKRVVSNEPKSPSCSWESMVSVEPPFLGEFGYDDDIDDVFVYTTDHYMYGMEWFNLYM